MKTKIAVLLFIFIAQYTSAENYLKDSTIWTEYGINVQGTPYVECKYQFMLMGDTIIAGKIYKKLYCNLSYFGALRESDGKVYVVNLIYYPEDFDEFLVYDFTAKEGDTIRSNAIEGPISHNLVVHKIDSVILENGQKRKRLQLTGSSYASWIEGVGSDYGLLDPIFPKITNFTVTKLVCHKQKDAVTYSNPEFCFGDCCTFKVNSSPIKTVKNSEADITLEIANKVLEVGFSSSDGIMESIRLVDSNGVIIRNDRINSSGKIRLDISTLKSGIYLVLVESAQKIFTKKISI